MISRKLKIFAIFISIALLAGCSHSDNTSSQPVVTTPPVGDFNFIDQKPVSSVDMPSTSPSVSTDSGYTDNINVDIPAVTGTIADGSTDESPSAQESEIIDTRYVSPYVDLSTNSSIHIGSDVYVSIPQSIIEKQCGLDVFLESYRAAHTLIPEEDYADIGVINNIYAEGTCVSIDNSTLYINGEGIGYWCKCVDSTIDIAKAPDIRLFNLGTLKGRNGSISASYQALGNKLDSEENDFFYRAVYAIQDLEGTTVDGRAVLIFNKETSALSTCLIYLNKTYCLDTSANIELLAGSVRFSTTAPDNLISLV